MELTPKERHRIYKAEKARIEAQARLDEEAKRQSSGHARETGQLVGKQQGTCCIGCAAIFAVFIVLIVMLSRGSGGGSDGDSPQSAAARIGPHHGKKREQADRNGAATRRLEKVAKQLPTDRNGRQDADKDPR